MAAGHQIGDFLLNMLLRTALFFMTRGGMMWRRDMEGKDIGNNQVLYL
jgi:hypothetical protein